MLYPICSSSRPPNLSPQSTVLRLSSIGQFRPSPMLVLSCSHVSSLPAAMYCSELSRWLLQVTCRINQSFIQLLYFWQPGNRMVDKFVHNYHEFRMYLHVNAELRNRHSMPFFHLHKFIASWDTIVWVHGFSVNLACATFFGKSMPLFCTLAPQKQTCKCKCPISFAVSNGNCMLLDAFFYNDNSLDVCYSPIITA